MTDSVEKFEVGPWLETPHFALLSIDGLSLLLPQQDIHTVEPVLDLEPATNGGVHVGWISRDQERWPVHCLSADLELMRELPIERRVCVILDHDGLGFGLACEQMTSLQQAHLSFFAVPECMRMPGSPLRALARHSERVLCVTTAADLAGFLAHRDYLATVSQEGVVSEGVGTEEETTPSDGEHSAYG